MELNDFQRKAVLLIFISILAGAVLLARKEPLKTQETMPQTIRPVIQSTPAPAPVPVKIDINTADISLIMQLPGIGPSLAKGIIKYRPYKTAEDLLKVPGIGEKRLARIREYIDLPEKSGIQGPVVQGPASNIMFEDRPRTSVYDSRIDPKVKCPHCGKQLWEKGKRKMRYVRCPHCLKIV